MTALTMRNDKDGHRSPRSSCLGNRMTELTECVLPNGGKLVWADRYWVRAMLPADSMNKKLARLFVETGITAPIESAFNGALEIRNTSVSAESVLSSPQFESLNLEAKAAFANVGHIPPRIYLWLQGTSGWYFLKIGTTSDLTAFQNEFALSRLVPQHGALLLTPCIDLVQGAEWVALLSIGLSPQQLLRRRRLNAREVLRSSLFSSPQRAGPFGGTVHCDLGSNNVYQLDERIWVTDWEMASPSGPDFCDEIGLATVAVAERVEDQHFHRFLEEECGLAVSTGQLRCALRFLSARGNRAARRASARLESLTGNLPART